MDFARFSNKIALFSIVTVSISELYCQRSEPNLSDEASAGKAGWGHLDILGDGFSSKSFGWTFRVMEGQKSSASELPIELGAALDL